jgi:hypothetical protein
LNKLRIQTDEKYGFIGSVFSCYPPNVKITPFEGGFHDDLNPYIQKKLKILSQKIPPVLTNNDILEIIAFEERFINYFKVFDDSDSAVFI